MAATIAVCMATFNPNPELFAIQIASIREQVEEDWVCLISDDNSDPELFGRIVGEVAGDQRFKVSRSDQRVGFYRNFERALGMVPEGTAFVALSDQDDRWYPQKLSVLLAEIGDASLVYSDQRIVGESGDVISETYWQDRRNNYTNLLSLLIANTVTGAAALFRADILESALPFPEVPGEQYHDHWLALVAFVEGGLRYVDWPLYDYVQHDSAALGHEAANVGNKSLGLRRALPSHWREIFGGWGTCYFDVHLRIKALAGILINRCDRQMSKSDRQTLERYIKADRTLTGPVWMAARPLRRLTGHNETLGVERILARAFVYRDLMALRSKTSQKLQGKVGRPSTSRLSPSDGVSEYNRLRRKIQPLGLSVNPSVPSRVNLLIPSFDLKHLFGGYIAKFNLARRLAESGHRMRIVTIDPNPQLPEDWKSKIERFDGLDGLFDGIEVEFGREQGLLEISPSDRFIATTWWSALIAAKAVTQTDSSRFVYLIQEFEPLTVSQGSWAAMAMSSYSAPHFAVFSTDILAEYFESEKIGVFAEGDETSRANCTHFQNAITPVAPPAVEELTARKTRKLVFYARPEPHAARNLFELGLLALRTAVEEGRFGDEWEFFGIGSVGRKHSVVLGREKELFVHPRTGQADYGRLLGGHDLGLALMYAPHPSLVPLEMASAGVVTVTNSYATKTSESLGRISSNLIVAEPSLEGIANGLERGIALADDPEARIRGSKFDWPSDWDAALNDEVIASIGRHLK